MTATPLTPADPSAVLTIARAWAGTPYLHQSSVQGVGCDCLGLARGIWRTLHGDEPWEVPPYSRDWGEAGRREVLAEAARADPSEGRCSMTRLQILYLRRLHGLTESQAMMLGRPSRV